MRISERSWHLRMARWMKRYQAPEAERNTVYVPRDLCSYFWDGLVLNVVAFLLFNLFLAFVLGCVVILAPFWGPPYLAKKWWDRRRERQAGVRASYPNPLVEYVKAKKRRICPLIEVVD